MARLLLFIVAGIIALTAALARAQQEYTWDGHTLQTVYDITGIGCDHWVIWLYTDKTTNPQPARGWGEVDGASASEAEQNYEKRRDDMERMLNSTHTGTEVHIGPVCVLKRSGTGNAPAQTGANPELPMIETTDPNPMAQERKDLAAGSRIQGYADGTYTRPAVVTVYIRADDHQHCSAIIGGQGVQLLPMWDRTLTVSFTVSKGVITKSSFSEHQSFVRCIDSDEAKGLPKTTIEIKTKSATLGGSRG